MNMPKRKAIALILYCGWALMVPWRDQRNSEPVKTWNHISSHDNATGCQDAISQNYITAITMKSPRADVWINAKCVPVDVVYTHATGKLLERKD